MDNSQIPKFGSFKPKESRKTGQNDAAGTVAPKRREVVEHVDERHHRRKKARVPTPHDRHRKYATDDPDKFHSTPLRPFRNAGSRKAVEVIGVDERNESDLYLVDRRGDAKNAQYGSIHRADIPPYRRIGYGHIVGALFAAQIDRERSTDRDVYLEIMGRNRVTRATRPLTSKMARLGESRYKLVASTFDPVEKSDDEFISLHRADTRRRSFAEAESHEIDATVPDYRSIEGKAKVSQKADDDYMDRDGEPASRITPNDESSDLELVARQENAKLLQVARKAPLEIESWMDLVAHQSKLVHGGLDITSIKTLERDSLAKLRLSILDDACMHIHKDHRNRGDLLLKMMEEGMFIWDRFKIERKWEEVLLQCPSNTSVCRGFLDYSQGDSYSFTYETCRSSFLKCLASLKSPSSDILKSRAQTDQFHILLRLISFTRDAGYDEQATAFWQAILENCFFRPSRLLQKPPAATVEQFELFWESDVPRIGEQGASGWTKHDAEGEGQERAPAPIATPTLQPSNLFASFATEESRFSMLGTLPASSDDDHIEDPYRFVMFADIRVALESLAGHLPEHRTLNAFLAFYGLPSLAAQCKKDESWSDMTDPFLTKLCTGQSAGNLLEGVHIPESRAIRCQKESVLGLFSDGFKKFQVDMKSAQADGKDLTSFLDRSLEALVSALPKDDVLAEYFIAWKLHMFPNSARKTAKHLLKSRPSSLRLYNAFALVEATLGHWERAKDVWSTALRMRFSLTTDLQEDAILLWHSSALVYVQNNNEDAGLKSLFSITDDDEISATASEDINPLLVGQQLRVRQAMWNSFDRSLVKGESHHAMLYADCLAWLAYFINGYAVSDALAVYRRFEGRLREENYFDATELLVQGKVTLLNHHLAQKRPFKPAMWSAELKQDLERFPSNTMLLTLFEQMASHDRLRNMVLDQQRMDPSKATVIEWKFRLSQELTRIGIDGSGSNANTLRAMFSKALLHPESGVKHSPEIWTMWLDFEYQRALPHVDVEDANDAMHFARKVFLDGFRLIPWFKPWALRGMRYFGRINGNRLDLRQVYDAMVERGLRVRIDIDDLPERT